MARFGGGRGRDIHGNLRAQNNTQFAQQIEHLADLSGRLTRLDMGDEFGRQTRGDQLNR